MYALLRNGLRYDLSTSVGDFNDGNAISGLVWHLDNQYPNCT